MVMVDDCQDTQPMPTEDLPAQLCDLLTKQIAFGRQGDMGQVERLGGQVGAIIAAMASGPEDQRPMVEPLRTRLQHLYDELALVLQAEQADVQGRLKRLRHVKRAVGVYNHKKQRRG